VWAFPILLKIAALIIVPKYIKSFSITNFKIKNEQDSDDLKKELSKIYILKNPEDFDKFYSAIKL
jgi:hypothetical protein